MATAASIGHQGGGGAIAKKLNKRGSGSNKINPEDFQEEPGEDGQEMVQKAWESSPPSSPEEKIALPSTDGHGETSGGGQAKRLEIEQNEEEAEAKTLKQKVWRTMDDPSANALAKFISIFIMLLILVSTLSFILETVYTQEEYPEMASFWYGLESFAVTMFTCEYLIRLWATPARCKFVWEPMNLVDILAVLPFWISLIFSLAGLQADASFGFIRAVRLVRVFRVFKIGRYSNGIQIFAGAMSMSMSSLLILAFMMLIGMILFGSLIYYAECPTKDQCAAGFTNIPESFWWCVVTMTTVGYGDYYPQTDLGKVVGVVTMLSGILILALPITVVGSNFAKMVDMYEEDAMLYDETDTSGDGMIDENELRDFLLKKKKEGSLVPHIQVHHAAQLIKQFGSANKGTLDMQEFGDLQRQVVSMSSNDRSLQTLEKVKKLESMMQNNMTANTEKLEKRMEALEGRLTEIMDRIKG